MKAVKPPLSTLATVLIGASDDVQRDGAAVERRMRADAQEACTQQQQKQGEKGTKSSWKNGAAVDAMDTDAGCVDRGAWLTVCVCVCVCVHG